MIAHAIINLPMTPAWQGALLVVFVIGAFFVWRGGLSAVKQVFRNAKVTACIQLVLVQSVYVLEAGRIKGMIAIAIGMLLMALVLEAIDRQQSRRAAQTASSIE